MVVCEMLVAYTLSSMLYCTVRFFAVCTFLCTEANYQSDAYISRVINTVNNITNIGNFRSFIQKCLLLALRKKVIAQYYVCPNVFVSCFSISKCTSCPISAQVPTPMTPFRTKMLDNRTIAQRYLGGL